MWFRVVCLRERIFSVQATITFIDRAKHSRPLGRAVARAINQHERIGFNLASSISASSANAQAPPNCFANRIGFFMPLPVRRPSWRATQRPLKRCGILSRWDLSSIPAHSADAVALLCDNLERCGYVVEKRSFVRKGFSNAPAVIARNLPRSNAQNRLFDESSIAKSTRPKRQ